MFKQQASSFKYDQGFFNTVCSLVNEITARNHLNFLCELDASGMDRMRHKAKTSHQPAPTYTAFVVKAAAKALRLHPHLNVMIQEAPFRRRLVPLKTMTATVAVERIVGDVDMVLAPRIERPDQISLGELTLQLRRFALTSCTEIPEMAEFISLTRWARWLPSLTGSLFKIPALSPALWERYRGGSYVVTSPGKYGGFDQVLPPWPWPLTFSFGHIKTRPWVVDGQLQARKTMKLTISADRRMANGAPLARFAEDVRNLLENPERMEEGLPTEHTEDTNTRMRTLITNPRI